MMQFFLSVSSPFTQHKLPNYKIIKKKSKPSLKQSVSSIQKQLCYRVSHTPFPHAPPSSPSLLHSLPSRGMHCFSPLQGLAAQHLTWVCDVNIKRSPEKACRLLWQHSAGPRHTASDAAVLYWANTNTLTSLAQSTHSSHCPRIPHQRANHSRAKTRD